MGRTLAERAHGPLRLISSRSSLAIELIRGQSWIHDVLARQTTKGTSEMAQQAKGLATKPDNLSATPGTYMTE